mmetsp:Transcript_26241/g.84847  ORF Transcript_26241/g.84847 Transcript_26241/m.84847 type:complete len:196 (+) Transcript_26241:3444-4031(+)
MTHIADRLALGMIHLLRVKRCNLTQSDTKLIIDLLAETSKYYRGQPYIATAAVTMIGTAPGGPSSMIAWRTCRELVLSVTEQQVVKLVLMQNLKRGDRSTLKLFHGTQRLIVALSSQYTSHDFIIEAPSELHKDILRIWALLSTAARDSKIASCACLHEMIKKTETLLRASNIICSPVSAVSLKNESNAERFYIV